MVEILLVMRGDRGRMWKTPRKRRGRFKGEGVRGNEIYK